MDGVGRGTELAGRYRLVEPLHGGDDPQGTRRGGDRELGEHADWHALDRTLGRDVVVRVVRGPAAEDVLDAGRRAAVVEDPRLQRVLDVGTHLPGDGAEPLAFVVFEAVHGVSLSQLIERSSQLPAARVRAIVGEAAAALARAAQSGVHHGALRPGVVLRTRDGEIKITGLAVDAVTSGGLTSGSVTSGAGSAGSGDGGGRRGDDTVPLPVVDDDMRPPAPRRPTPTGVSAADQDDAVGLVALLYAGLTGRWPLPEVPGSPTGLQPAPVVEGFPVPPDDLVGGVPNDLDTLCAVVLGPHDDGPRTPAEVVQQLRPWGPVEEPSAAQEAPRATVARTATPSAARAPGRISLRLPFAAGAGATAVPQPVPASQPAAATTTGGGHAGGRGDARGEQSDAYGDDADEADDADDDRAYDDRAYGDRDPFAGLGRDQDDAVGERRDEDEESRSRLALLVVAVVVVLGLAFALNSLRGIGGDDEAPPAADPAPTQSAPAAEPEAPPAEEEPPAQDLPVIAGIRTLDPEGDDGTENDDSAPRAIDDDPASTWNSSTYASSDFGGLKDGVGLAIPLGAPAVVSGATITMNGEGGVVELRAAPGLTLDDSTVLASGSPADGVVDLSVAEPVETGNVILWFTELPEVSGEFRIEVGQVQLR